MLTTQPTGEAQTETCLIKSYLGKQLEPPHLANCNMLYTAKPNCESQTAKRLPKRAKSKHAQV